MARPIEKKSVQAGGETKPVLSLSLTITQLWALGATAAAFTIGTFGFGIFTADQVKNPEITALTTKNGDLERNVTAITGRLKATLTEAQNLKTKDELLTRLVYYLQSHDETSKKLLTDVVCSMWKESEEHAIRLKQGSIELTPLDLANALPPEVEKILASRGVSDEQLRLIREPINSGSASVNPVADFQKVIRVQQQAMQTMQREQAIVDVTDQAGHVETIKIVSFPDGSQFQIPQEIAAAVHLKPECAPQAR
jgi:hypothetical protein